MAGFTVDQIDDIKIAVSEVLLALIEHGGGASIEIEFAIENRCLENRTSGDVDIAVDDDCTFWAIVDGERILVSHLSQGCPPVG